ncbi:MAG: sigma-70 family RNA polymerase sigma factor [Pirellulales bacterium]|nr:sigma-70 family RNA polymerase sigma factor [Pirellulales bacterium]
MFPADSPSEQRLDPQSPRDENLADDCERPKALDPRALAEDAGLVARCIGGEVAAWEELYRKCHEPLCTTIRIHLGKSGSDAQLVDELAARVWYALVDRDGKQLTKYSPRRGSILTYIRLIARKEISHHFRSEQRRLKKEFASLVHRNRRESADRSESLSSMLAEFLSSLTPRERDFCCEYLHVSGDDNAMLADHSFSSAYIWQMTRRIYKKFLSYVGPAP